jgi:glycosyltransferase involved in cell wall biosynthesis
VINGISTDRVKSNDGFKRPLPRVFKVVQVSRLDHGKKGQDLLIEAVSRLSDLGYKLSVDFIGDGSSCGFLQKLCGDKGISDRVHFLGTCSRDYVYEHLKDYNLLVQPSRYEGFGLTVAEAMAAKIPVLVSDIEGPMEVIGHGRFGHAFKCGSADSLTAVLRSVLDNYQAAEDLAQGDAYDYARTNFSVATSASRYIDLYKSIVDTAK